MKSLKRIRLFSSLNKNDLQKYGNVLGGENMGEKQKQAFKSWHETLDGFKRNKSSVDLNKSDFAQFVDESCIFHPPTYFKPWEGKDNILTILSCAAETFGESFEYQRQFISPDGKNWGLEFNTKIGDTGKSIKGIDLVELNDEGKIINFTVLARPPNGVEALKSEMMKKVPLRLASNKAKQFFKF